DHSAGSSNIDISMSEFKDCVEEIEVLDVNRPGLNFTWNQKPKGDGVLKKIDRIMANVEFQDIFIGAHAIFQPYRISYHSPAVLKIPRSTTVIPKPFKFSYILIYNVRFKDVVKDGWDLLKAVKGRVSRSRIDVVSDSNGVLFEADQVPIDFVNHNVAFIGQQGVTYNFNTHNLFTKKLDSSVAFEMIKTVTNQEVKDAIFSMGNDKSPGPDGYTAAFLKNLGMLWLMMSLERLKNFLLTANS
nr:RNA-directed DNA polymerase, eukaryota, reverse transcriptase zinc-binding domain protein [Tanacetum cinerariifolium]